MSRGAPWASRTGGVSPREALANTPCGRGTSAAAVAESLGAQGSAARSGARAGKRAASPRGSSRSPQGLARGNGGAVPESRHPWSETPQAATGVTVEVQNPQRVALSEIALKQLGHSRVVGTFFSRAALRSWYFW